MHFPAFVMNESLSIILVATAVVLFTAVGYVLSLRRARKKIVGQHGLRLREVEKSEKKYRSLFENSVAGMFRLAIDSWTVQDVNLTCLELFHCENRSEFETRLHQLPEEIRKHIKEELEKNRRISNLELQTGNSQWLLLSAKLESATTAHLVVVDITNRKKNEETIEEQAQLLNESSDAIIVLDEAGGICYWNKTAEAIYGWSGEDAVGRELRSLLYGPDEAPDYDTAVAAISKCGEWHGECSQGTKSGKKRLIEGHWKQVTSKHFGRKMTLMVNADITEKRQHELHTLRAQKLEMLTLLTGGIAHDLHNILAPVAMSIGLIEEDPGNPNTPQILETIKQSTQNGLNLVKRILAFGRGVKGKKTKVDITRVVIETLDHFNRVNTKSIAIKKRVGRKKYYVDGDRQQLEQVLFNLYGNARDALDVGGTLEVVVGPSADGLERLQDGSNSETDKFVDITIRDNGIGITEEDMKRIFDPFFTTKASYNGTGLGLTVVQSIIQRHGGEITIESQYRKGSAFHVLLPITIG